MAGDGDGEAHQDAAERHRDEAQRHDDAAAHERVEEELDRYRELGWET
jgi:hypothetical protein